MSTNASPIREQTRDSDAPIKTSDAEVEGVLQEDDRHRHIAEAAYRRAEGRGFASGQELNDWLEAEKEVNNS